MADEAKQVLRPVDAEAIRMGKGLMRTARHGAVAVIEPGSGWPRASRVAVATDIDGTPVILVSALSDHTAAIEADARCSLLLGEPGKGDPLAHPRITLLCEAERLERGAEAHSRCERRFLARHPKAALYAGFGDFSFFRLVPRQASLNGGFGKAYRLEQGNLLSDPDAAAGLAEIESEAVEHMNDDHAEAVELYARHLAGGRPGSWRLGGIDPDGLDLALGDDVLRVFFDDAPVGADRLRATLAEMARRCRKMAGG